MAIGVILTSSVTVSVRLAGGVAVPIVLTIPTTIIVVSHECQWHIDDPETTSQETFFVGLNHWDFQMDNTQ